MTVAKLRRTMPEQEFQEWALFFEAEKHWSEVERLKGG